MTLRWLNRWAFIFGPALVLAAASGGEAMAQCGSCTPTPSPCCAPPSPPTPAPPCCGSGGHQVRVPGVNVTVAPTVVVNAGVSAVVNASSAAAGNVFVYGGGGSSYSVGGGAVSVIQGLNVEGAGVRRAAYQASRTKVRIVVIQAVCLDDKQVPHPASQVGPDRDIRDDYDGELYRCIAGARMQVTFADYAGKVAFDQGQTITCNKNEALYYSGGAMIGEGGQRAGKMECRVQKPARDCNERSLLRRYGAGVKIIRIVTTESYTAYREEAVQSSSMSSSSLSLDGGVGGISY